MPLNENSNVESIAPALSRGAQIALQRAREIQMQRSIALQEEKKRNEEEERKRKEEEERKRKEEAEIILQTLRERNAWKEQFSSLGINANLLDEVFQQCPAVNMYLLHKTCAKVIEQRDSYPIQITEIWQLAMLSRDLTWIMSSMNELYKQDQGGRNKAHYLAMTGNYYCLSVVLDHYPQLIDTLSHAGYGIPFYAASSGNYPCLSGLLKKYPHFIFDSSHDRDDRASLAHLLVKAGYDVCLLELLKEYPQFIDSKDHEGLSIKDYTFRYKQYKPYACRRAIERAINNQVGRSSAPSLSSTQGSFSTMSGNTSQPPVQLPTQVQQLPQPSQPVVEAVPAKRNRRLTTAAIDEVIALRREVAQLSQELTQSRAVLQQATLQFTPLMQQFSALFPRAAETNAGVSNGNEHAMSSAPRRA